MASESNSTAAAPADPLSNFAYLPFTSPDPSAISLLWNAAQPFLTSGENVNDGIFAAPSPSNANGADPNGSEPETAQARSETDAASAPSAPVAPSDANLALTATRAHEYLTAVSLRIDSLEMAVRYSCMNGPTQQLMIDSKGEESWNVLLPQVVDVAGAVSVAVALCKDEPHKITTSGILPTLLRLIDTTITVSAPPDSNPKLNRGSILDAHGRPTGEKPTTHCLTPFHAIFLQCCILSQQFRYAQRFLQSHPVHTHSLILSANNVMISNTPTPRFDTHSYLRFHYYAGMVHIKCQDWNAALSSFHLCLTVPCIGSSLNGISHVSIAARKKMLLIRCALLEAEEMDGHSSGGGRKSKSKKSTAETKVLDMPGAASQAMCRYMSNPSKRVDVSEGRSAAGPNPERAGERGSETGEEKRDHSMRRKQRHFLSSSSEGADRGPPLTSSQQKNIRQLGQYHDLVSTYITGISSHYATLLVEMKGLLVADGNWDLAKRLEVRLAYRAVREVASTYSAIGMNSLQKTVGDSCGAPVQDLIGSKDRIEDTLGGMMFCDWEDVLVSDPFYAKIDQKLGVATFIEGHKDAAAREGEDAQWLEYDLSKRMDACIILAERVRDLDIQLTSSQKYQQQSAKWEVKPDVATKQGQGQGGDLGHSPMDVGADW